MLPAAELQILATSFAVASRALIWSRRAASVPPCTKLQTGASKPSVQDGQLMSTVPWKDMRRL